MDEKAGIYFLRTSLNGKEEKTLWMIYNLIREIHNFSRVLKTDLDLRPIYHKTDEASMANLHLGLLAYWLVSTIRYNCKANDNRHSKGFQHFYDLYALISPPLKTNKAHFLFLFPFVYSELWSFLFQFGNLSLVAENRANYFPIPCHSALTA